MNTSTKIYKDSWNALESDLRRCLGNYPYRVRYAGIYALLGDVLLVKLDGRMCTFNEKTFEFVEWR